MSKLISVPRAKAKKSQFIMIWMDDKVICCHRDGKVIQCSHMPAAQLFIVHRVIVSVSETVCNKQKPETLIIE